MSDDKSRRAQNRRNLRAVRDTRRMARQAERRAAARARKISRDAKARAKADERSRRLKEGTGGGCAVTALSLGAAVVTAYATLRGLT